MSRREVEWVDLLWAVPHGLILGAAVAGAALIAAIPAFAVVHLVGERWLSVVAWIFAAPTAVYVLWRIEGPPWNPKRPCWWWRASSPQEGEKHTQE